MSQLNEIIEGWKNLAFKSPKHEAMAIERMNKCLSCEELKPKSKRCSKCGCYMPAKVRSERSKCPLNKW